MDSVSFFGWLCGYSLVESFFGLKNRTCKGFEVDKIVVGKKDGKISEIEV